MKPFTLNQVIVQQLQSVTKYVDWLGRDYNKSPHPPYSMLLDEN